jgi:hypothetical protein
MKKLFLFWLLTIFSLQLYGMGAPRSDTDAERLLHIAQRHAESNNHVELFPLHNEKPIERAFLQRAIIPCLAIGIGVIMQQSGYRVPGEFLIGINSFSLFYYLSLHREQQRIMDATETTASHYLKARGWEELLTSEEWKNHLKNVDLKSYVHQLNTNNAPDNDQNLLQLKSLILNSLPASYRV